MENINIMKAIAKETWDGLTDPIRAIPEPKPTMKEQYLKALDGDDFWSNAAKKLIEPLSEKDFILFAQQGFSVEAFRMAAFAREFKESEQ